MNLLAPVNRDDFGRAFDASARTQGDIGGQPGTFPLDSASLLGLFARIHALGLAHLASGGSVAPQANDPITDQRWSPTQVPSQALPGGLLALLATAGLSEGSPRFANVAPAPAETQMSEPANAGQAEDRTRQRRVSGIADQMSDGIPSPLARVTNCDDAFTSCLHSIKDMRSAGKCERMKALCLDGVPGIFRSGVGGSRTVN
jgi:hypothetical protein